jgi:hypothetical protein
MMRVGAIPLLFVVACGARTEQDAPEKAKPPPEETDAGVDAGSDAGADAGTGKKPCYPDCGNGCCPDYENGGSWENLDGPWYCCGASHCDDVAKQCYCGDGPACSWDLRCCAPLGLETYGTWCITFGTPNGEGYCYEGY